MKISLTALERTARAADKELPGSLYSFDPHDGWDAPGGDAVGEHIDASDPATMISLIRHIRELRQIAKRALGEWRAGHAEVSTSSADGWKATDAEIEAMIKQVEAGAVRYGGWDAEGNWDIDRVAEDEVGK